MTIVCSRHGLTLSSRRLRASRVTSASLSPYSTIVLRRDAPSPSSTKLDTDESPTDLPLPSEDTVGNVDRDERNTRDGASHVPGHRTADPTRLVRHSDDILYDGIRHQLQLRSPSDVLRRIFFRSQAHIRSKKIIRDVLKLLDNGQHAAFTRLESGAATAPQHGDHSTGRGTKSGIAHTHVEPFFDPSAASRDTGLDTSWQETLLDLPDGVRADRPGILCALISAQLDGCSEPADALRVYVTALQNADATEALKSIKYDNQELEPWFTWHATDPDVVRVLSTVVRRLEEAGVQPAPQLLEAGLLRSAEHFNLDGLRRFLLLLKDRLDLRESGLQAGFSVQSLLSEVLATLRRVAVLRQSKKSTSQHDTHRLCGVVHGPTPFMSGDYISHETASTASSSQQKDERFAIRTFFDPLDLNTSKPETYADYIVLLGLSQLRGPVIKAWEAYTSSPAHATVLSEPSNPIMRAYMESFFTLGRLDLAWQTLRSSAFRTGEGDPVFELMLLRRATEHASWRGMADSLSADERAAWQRRLGVHRAVVADTSRDIVERELVAVLEQPIEEAERALGVEWRPETGRHVLNADFARLCAEELRGRSHDNWAGDAHAETVLQRLVTTLWGREGEDAVREVRQLVDAEDAEEEERALVADGGTTTLDAQSEREHKRERGRGRGRTTGPAKRPGKGEEGGGGGRVR